MTDNADDAIAVDDRTAPSLRGTKISEKLAARLAQLIVEGDLAEGTPLPNEKQMSEQYALGRTTIREALRLLETRGLLSIRPGRGGGPVVRRPKPSDLGEALRFQFQFDGVRLSDVVEARHALEDITARLAAERITDQQLDELQATIDMMLVKSRDDSTFTECNAKFHSVIASASGSLILAALVGALQSIADGQALGVRYTPSARLGTAHAHEAIVDALRRHDPDATEAAMKAHLDEAEAYWRRRSPDAFYSRLRWEAVARQDPMY
jgi:GntR family transcriptional regulator, transcriptional repressor for pyruvate dehydrogenase complex